MKITLTPGIYRDKNDCFYVEFRNGKYYIGHRCANAKETHEIPVSETFYLEFIKESQLIQQKYDKLIK